MARISKSLSWWSSVSSVASSSPSSEASSSASSARARRSLPASASSRSGLSIPLSGLVWAMTAWARSGTSQKSWASIFAVSSASCFSLAATSKRVSQLGDAAEQVIGPAAQVGVHPLLLNGPGVSPRWPHYTTPGPVRAIRGQTARSPNFHAPGAARRLVALGQHVRVNRTTFHPPEHVMRRAVVCLLVGLALGALTSCQTGTARDADEPEVSRPESVRLAVLLFFD